MKQVPTTGNHGIIHSSRQGADLKDALLLVDIQNDYFPSGNMVCAGMERAADNAARLLTQSRHDGRPVFHIQHLSTRPGATFFPPETKDVEIHTSVAPDPGEPIINKHFPNSFRETTLPDQLQESGIEHVTICGAMSQMCIDATTRAAFDLGYCCTVVDDACATRDLQHSGQTIEAQKVHAAFMAALAVPYASVRSTETVLSGTNTLA